MKKIILFLPILALFLAGCDGGDSNSSTSGTSDDSSTSTAEPLPPPVVSDINGEEISHEANDGDIIKLMHMNDTHGSIEYLPDNNEPGMAYIAGYVNEKRAQENTDVVLLSSGDMFQGSLDSNINQGKLMIDIMKEMRFDSMSIGNHEFDWGVDVLAENAQYALDSDRATGLFLFCPATFWDPRGSMNSVIFPQPLIVARPASASSVPSIAASTIQLTVRLSPVTNSSTPLRWSFLKLRD